MSEEEKKAIEELEEFIEDNEILNISVFTAKKIKNIIEKQQKEIDRLKKDKDILYGVIDELKGVNDIKFIVFDEFLGEEDE